MTVRVENEGCETAARLALTVTGTAGYTVSVNPPSGVSVVPVM